MDIKTYKANWYKKNRVRILAERQQSYTQKRAYHCAKAAKWRADNREKFLEYLKVWRKNNKARASEQVRLCHAKRRKTDVLYRLELRLRWRLWSVIRGVKGYSAKTRELLGCSLVELKEWLETQFQSGMSWDNYGEWHIDHVTPCAAFDFSKQSEIKKCFHFSNLQPLWALDNASKGARDNTERSR